MEIPDPLRTPPVRVTQPTSAASAPRPIPDQSAFISIKLEKRRRSDISDMESKGKDKPTKSPPASRIFAAKPTYHTAHAHFIWRDNDLFDKNLAAPTDASEYFETNFTHATEIGKGEFATVWRCRFVPDGKFYAVKKSKKEFKSAKDRELALQEVRNVMVIKKHRHCVQYAQAWEQRGHLFIQMELCDRSLMDQVEQQGGEISDEDLWRCLYQITLGLKHIHDSSLVHLDIKPGNLFLKEGLLKIGDFGRAHVSKGAARFEEGMEGDRRYMAPELLRNQVQPPADIFSLGLTMFELASMLQLPDNGESWQGLRSGHIPPDDLYEKRPQGLRTLIRRMLAPEPADVRATILYRPTCDQILANADLIAAVQRLGGLEPMCCPETPLKEESPQDRSLEDVDTSFEVDGMIDDTEPRPVLPVGIRPKNLLFEFDKVG